MPKKGEIWFRKKYASEGCKQVLVHSVDGKYVHIIDDDGNKASILKERWHEYFGKSPAEAIAKAEQATA